MTSKVEDIKSAVFRALFNGRLHEAITLIKPIYDGHPSLIGYDELMRIEQDHTTMCDYMLRGYADPQREQLYNRLLHDLYRLTANLMISWRCKNVAVYASAFRSDDKLNRSHDFLKTVLERYVSDQGMLSLQKEEERLEASQKLYGRHQAFMERLFNALFISLQWTEADEKFYSELLTSPLIDREDSQLILSALMLAVMNVYDERKWATMAYVYQHTTDEAIRQRALVGWALTMDSHVAFFVKQTSIFKELTANKDTLSELLELQKQVFFCMNAEKDNTTIRKDIMPDMMKGSQLRMGQFGIIEHTDDELSDIINPTANEEAMEKVEQSVERMRKMEQRGADIYFGGFAQMKRFPFFYSISNWFAPYNSSHPEIATAQKKVGDSQIINMIVSQGTMCDSDKYSLVLAMGQVFDKLPANLREAMHGENAWGAFPPSTCSTSSPAFIRRMYLQNLYRFFRIWPSRSQITSCFSDEPKDMAFFFCAPLFAEYADTSIKVSLGEFLLRHGMFERLERLLQTINHKDGNERTKILQGHMLMHKGKYAQALDVLKTLLGTEYETTPLLRSLAKAAMAAEDYFLAYECYAKLVELSPDTPRMILNRSLAAQRIGQGDDAIKDVYELYYHHPDNQMVQRVLAWLLLNSDIPSKAKPIYAKILSENPTPEDYINTGYCHWILGDVKEAYQCFCHYSDVRQIEKEFRKDKELLARHGISTTDSILMADTLCKNQG